MNPRGTLTAAELADTIGVSIGTLYRQHRRWQAEDGLPAPITRGGRLRWDRASVAAWLGRHHPLAPRRAPANSSAPPVVPASTEDWRTHLASVYGGGGR